ncbi:MAG: hydrogenase formation protein HypD [Candidatus Bathyarchaeia archaeon]
MGMFRYRDREIAGTIVERLKTMRLKVRLMHVCGTHQDTVMRFGLDSLLADCGVEVRQGPGCPVCVTTDAEFTEAAQLAKRGKVLASFGDVLRVPTRWGSLLNLRGRGADVRVVYSIEDAVTVAKETTRDVVFFAVGFETTAPCTAATLLSDPPRNFSILCAHRYVPPALDALLGMGEVKLQGLIEPGHVSTVIGVKPYEELSRKYKLPQVVAGFEPLDLLVAVYMLTRQIKEGRAEVENEYRRSVRYEGNPKALRALREVFEPCDVAWRGFPTVPSSGMALRKSFENRDARRLFEDDLEELFEAGRAELKACRCGDVLRGAIEPTECPLFARSCTPLAPVGPCMVSVEGSCQIQYRYRPILAE